MVIQGRLYGDAEFKLFISRKIYLAVWFVLLLRIKMGILDIKKIKQCDLCKGTNDIVFIGTTDAKLVLCRGCLSFLADLQTKGALVLPLPSLEMIINTHCSLQVLKEALPKITKSTNFYYLTNELNKAMTELDYSLSLGTHLPLFKESMHPIKEQLMTLVDNQKCFKN
ncbi:hypothetical protein AB8613_23970 [Vibrio sp. BS-M-Sm-2]|uniref:hypothetical protein n=1 Tax=Vibrio sp. BS-M-Sm-2 TaxID=3241167 RepID=UPI003557CF23